MAILSSAIVARQAASPQAVESALARQVLYGGDVVTNLLELGAAAEADLCAVLADVYGFPTVPPGALPRADASTLRLVSIELANRYELVPLEEHDGTLTVAVSEPLDAQTMFRLEETLGLALAQNVALSVRIRQALCRDYGLPLERRSARLLAKLEGLQDPSPSVAPNVDASGRELQASPRPDEPRGPTPEATAGSDRYAAARISLRPSVRAPGQRPRERHIGPYTAVSARLDLCTAATRDEVVDAFFDFVAQYFEYTALFVVHGDLAEGRDAYGPGTDRTRISAIGVPLDLPSALATARDAGRWQIVHLGAKSLDQALARDLGRHPEGLVFVLPIVLRGRCVMLIYGDRGESDVEASHVADVVSFGTEVSAALERILVLRKRGGLVSLLPPSASESSGLFERALGDARNADARLSAMAASALDGSDERTPRSSLSDAPSATHDHEVPTVLPPPLERSEADDALLAPDASSDGVTGELDRAWDSDRLSPEPPPAAEDPGDTPADQAPSAEAEPESATHEAADVPAPALEVETAPKQPEEQTANVPAPALEVEAAPKQPDDQTAVEPDSDDADEPPPGGRPASDRPGPVVVSTAKGSAPPDGTRRRQRRATLRHSALAEALRPARTISIEPPNDMAESDRDAPSSQRPLSDLARPVVTISGRARAGTPAPGLLADSRVQMPGRGDTDEVTEAIPLTRRTFSRRSPPAPAVRVQPDSESTAASATASDRAGSDNTASRAVSYSPRPPLPARVLPDVRLPSVIVDVGEDCQALVDRVVAGDREAAELLVIIGQPAIAVAAGRLPGPVPSGNQKQLGDTRASECGLLLEVLARLGRASVPFVAVRAADADPVVRTWATRLLGELPSPEAVRSVVPRLSDKSPEVRQAALAATRMLLAHLDTHDRLLAELDQLAAPSSSKTHRLVGIRALRELHHAAAVPALLTLLDERDKDLSQAAQSALVETTRQDLGAEKTRWTQWWNKNRTRHRIEWLIDSLMHDSPEMRREAGDELKTLTKEYFGYYGDLPTADRSRAQQQYREWWETRGRAKFR